MAPLDRWSSRRPPAWRLVLRGRIESPSGALEVEVWQWVPQTPGEKRGAPVWGSYRVRLYEGESCRAEWDDTDPWRALTWGLLLLSRHPTPWMAGVADEPLAWEPARPPPPLPGE